MSGFVFSITVDINIFNIKKGTRNSASTVEKMADFKKLTQTIC